MKLTGAHTLAEGDEERSAVFPSVIEVTMTLAWKDCGHYRLIRLGKSEILTW